MAYGQERAGSGQATSAGDGKAAGGGSCKKSAGHQKLMAATKQGGKAFMSEAAGKLSEKTKG